MLTRSGGFEEVSSYVGVIAVKRQAIVCAFTLDTQVVANRLIPCEQIRNGDIDRFYELMEYTLDHSSRPKCTFTSRAVTYFTLLL